MAAIIPEAGLGSTEKSIPLVGLGLAVYPFGDSPETIQDAVLNAIKLGYRLFDTASLYGTEEALGEAISQALHLGFIKSRDELFIISKLGCSDAHPGSVIPALKTTLKNLKLDYLDMYLIHWPLSVKQGKSWFPVEKEDLLPIDLKSVWEDMEECQNLGLAKSIGVSNFSCKKLQTILDTAKIPPAMNQVEMNPLWQQKVLREFCKEKGITMAGYSPLGAKGTLWGTNRVMECQELKEIAQSKGKSLAQICLRWVYEQGVVVLVKSFNNERMKENLEIFDWELSSEELKKIGQLPQRKGFQAKEFTSEEYGPYKSIDEFWDGEI